ncbi:MAG: PglZ domain-containing protein [Chloroflexi bacterium]|nr:PglZ domain-containing protein [Chloroflexota bacterium]
MMSLRDWLLSRLEAVKESSNIVVKDHLLILPSPETDSAIDAFARNSGYTVIVAATNMVFRDLYERAIADPETQKLLLVDRTPARRRIAASTSSAPPLFYPDLLTNTPGEAIIDLDLRQFLVEVTGDPTWPLETNDPQCARFISRSLPGVLIAHQKLRNASKDRFTDHDLQTIVAHAALGVPESAFKKLEAEDYWRIGLLSHEALAELESLLPDVTNPIKDALIKAPPPFRWLANHDPETVVRACYLAAILEQHLGNWALLLANVDPSLVQFTGVEANVLREAAAKLVEKDPIQAGRDLQALEDGLDKDALRLLLIDQMKLSNHSGFAAAVQREHYSTLVRSLALLLGLDNSLAVQPALPEHNELASFLFTDTTSASSTIVELRTSQVWSNLKEAYSLSIEIKPLRDALADTIKLLKVTKTADLDFRFFRTTWNDKRINRLEYYLSALERLVGSAEFLPRAEDELPSLFVNAIDRIRKRVRDITAEVNAQLDELNRRFQDVVAIQYPNWVTKDSEVRLTSQFIRRCLKAHWDPMNEKAVVLIFDGLRYDIWDELLKPILLDRLEIVEDLPASSLLPTETHITRKAISAGTFPDEFDTGAGEDKLLKNALVRELNYSGDVKVMSPPAAGTGETVRYRAGNLDVYIFELCDSELHKVKLKTLPDGREVPSRPLAFVYQQHLKNIIDTEVMAIVRALTPQTKVFVIADHGFGRISRQPLWFEEGDLNEPSDCSYLNCRLRYPVHQINLPQKVRDNIIAFTPQQLRMPQKESVAGAKTGAKSGSVAYKEYGAIVFPRIGYSFRRSGSPYNPDAYSHGGISIQEMLIPMVVLRAKSREEGSLVFEPIVGPKEAVEGEELEYRFRFNRTPQSGAVSDEIKVEIEGNCSREADHLALQRRIIFVPVDGLEVPYRFRPDPSDATIDERRQGVMERTLTITASYRKGTRTIRKVQMHRFTLRLNSEKVVRRVGNLGNILGLTPKGMR